MTREYIQCYYLTNNKQLYCLHRDKIFYSVIYNCQYYSFGIDKWLPSNIPYVGKMQEISQEEANKIVNESRMLKELRR